MARWELTMRGGEEARERLERAGGAAGRRAVRSVVLAAVLRAEGRAKRNATRSPRVRSGRLRASIAGAVRSEGRETVGVLGTPVKYARIQEEGGVVVPVRAQWLTIPTRAARTKAGVTRVRAREMQGLRFAVVRPGRLAMLYRPAPGGERTVFWWLVKRVEVPAHWYLRTAILAEHRRLPDELGAEMARLLTEG